MRIATTLAAIAALSATPAFAADDTQAFIQKALTEMNNALPGGNVAIYDKYLDPNCFYVQENDTISTKADMLKDAGSSLPKGITAHIDVEILNFSRDGDIAVAVARDHETENYFGQVLHAIRSFHAQRKPHHDEVRQQKQENQQFHRHGIRDRSFRIRRGHIHCMQQRVHRPGEVLIQKSSKK